MEWKKVLWRGGLDYYPGPNGKKLYTRWIKGDEYLLEICEDTKKTAYGHATSFQIREMSQRELSDFCNIFSLQLEDFPSELKDTVLNDLREYFNIKNTVLCFIINRVNNISHSNNLKLH